MSDLLFLSAEDVSRVRPDLPRVLALVEGILRAHAQGEIENPPKIGVHPRPDAFVHAMPGFVRSTDLVGVKCVSGYPDNPARGLPNILGVLLLLRPDTGVPYALMECGWVTAARTAAATALLVRECASPSAETLVILGAGVQARAVVPAVCQVRSRLRQVIVYDIRREATDLFLAEMSACCSVEMIITDDLRSAIEAADVVVAATGPIKGSLVRNEWLRAGALLVAVGSGFGLETLRVADRIVATDAEQMMVTARLLLGLSPSSELLEGAIPPVHAELGEILSGRKPGRTSPTERIFAYNSGLAVFDLAVGQAVFEAARAMGVGRWLRLF